MNPLLRRRWNLNHRPDEPPGVVKRPSARCSVILACREEAAGAPPEKESEPARLAGPIGTRAGGRSGPRQRLRSRSQVRCRVALRCRLPLHRLQGPTTASVKLGLW